MSILAAATAYVSGTWKKALPYILALVAALGILWSVVRLLLGAGGAKERANSATSIIKDVEKRHEVDARVDREPNPAERLRNDWSRD